MLDAPHGIEVQAGLWTVRLLHELRGLLLRPDTLSGGPELRLLITSRLTVQQTSKPDTFVRRGCFSGERARLFPYFQVKAEGYREWCRRKRDSG